jgi:hypothetical protein
LPKDVIFSTEIKPNQSKLKDNCKVSTALQFEVKIPPNNKDHNTINV